jgi:hypothetical protein
MGVIHKASKDRCLAWVMSENCWRLEEIVRKKRKIKAKEVWERRRKWVRRPPRPRRWRGVHIAETQKRRGLTKLTRWRSGFLMRDLTILWFIPRFGSVRLSWKEGERWCENDFIVNSWSIIGVNYLNPCLGINTAQVIVITKIRGKLCKGTFDVRSVLENGGVRIGIGKELSFG